MNLWNRFYTAIVCVVLLAVPALVLRSGLTNPSQRDAMDRLFLPLSATLQDLAAPLSRGIADVWDRYVYLLHVRRDNERLQSENARLEEETRRLRAALEENRRLRRLLQLREDNPVESYPADVVAKDTSPFFRILRLAIQAPEGVRLREGLPVLSPDGLIGHISSLRGKYANVTLVSDIRSNVDAMIERTGARGTVHGTGENNRYAAQMEYLERTDDVRVGDAVVTTGLGCRFPAGLLVGRVTSVTRREFGVFQEVEITPAVDFSRLHEVLVLATEPTECRPGYVPPRRGGSRAP